MIFSSQSRHRSPSNFLVNLLSGLAAYSHQEKKPSLNFDSQDNCLMIAALKNPKLKLGGKSLEQVSDKDLEKPEFLLNNRPQKVLNFWKSSEIFSQLSKENTIVASGRNF